MQHPSLDLRITTNGTDLLRHLPGLHKIKIGGINLSLDTLDRHRFAHIARHDKLEAVLSGFHMALQLGLPLKLNTVIQQDTTDNELLQMASLAKKHPITVRFIEFMPFSGTDSPNQTSAEPLYSRLLRLFPDMTEIPARDIATAKIFTIKGHQGNLGIIEGESRKFCGSCNKVRITPAGLMKNCLYDDGVLNLRDLLREGADDIEIGNQITAAVWNKQSNGHQAAGQLPQKCKHSMASIGG
jgi:cyclic pyranopterin phosphate synthase